MNDFGGMKSRGFGRAVTPAHCELFFGERPMALARWSDESAWERSLRSGGGGDRQTLTAGGHFAENCHIQHQGRY